MSSATATSTIHTRPSFSRSLRKPANTASTPDLNSVYSAQSRLLSRKTSFAALTPSSLASIPDVSESYAIDSVLNDPDRNMYHPTTPGRSSADDVAVGDIVDVPGGMNGTVRFVGTVQGKKGTFVGVELNSDFAAKGKNNGDVDGISYFSTNVANAGIFVPLAKALRRDSPTGSFSMTPTPNAVGGLRPGNQNSTNYTPPTPSLPKFSMSLGPGSRAPSPQGKKLRASMSRPESPVRRVAMAPGIRPSLGAPAAKMPARFGSPTNRFAQSVRGTAGDPAKRAPRMDRRPSLGASRSASAMGPMPEFDEEPMPMMPPPPPPPAAAPIAPPPIVAPPVVKSNGSVGSISSFSMKIQPAVPVDTANEEEMENLRSQLEERDRQLKEQASTLAEMEGSLTELQQLIEGSDVSRPRRSSLDDKDASQLRHMLREKNDKIAMLTAEFDAHRADFRSTIDTLEMASTETERVYEKRIDELMADIRELESRNLDVDSVASQLKQLEELVQELEEGLEDARRGEAEARGEAEFLRGEVERTRAELRREREKAASTPPSTNGDHSVSSKDLESKEDEIRGLKAIIHSLSRDSLPDGDGRTPTNSFIGGADNFEGRIVRDNLERKVAELQQALDTKNNREDELEHELEFLRTGTLNVNRSSANTLRSSLRDSRDTIIPIRPHDQRVPDIPHKRTSTLDTMHESDTYSTATGDSTLWCEICETSGHDILTCTNMFGPEGAKGMSDDMTEKDDGLKPLTPTGDDPHPAPLSPARSKTSAVSIPAVKIIPNPMDSGPVAGKESGILDLEKWCAVCERDGHDSVDCPFEDAF
ncbi:Tip elongation protein 1 [Cladobotryum mycophilum]|uniref:Tip elongation protein 1 n=1 Tax=Cladobotryum mycophilum TaxID=491253 RepID=A0ABR0SEU8_9HYPO